MRLDLLRSAPLAAGVLALSACALVPGSDSGGDGCRDVESTIIDEAMSSTKSDFQLPDGPRVDQLSYDDAAVVALPADEQRFGAESVVALRLKVSYGGDDATSSVPGIEDVVYLALDADDGIIAPVGSYSEAYFDLEPPSDPGWASWAEDVDASDTALDAFGCVDPDL